MFSRCNVTGSLTTQSERRLKPVTLSVDPITHKVQVAWASPLIKIKSALTRLKAELKQMDIRIGVVTHTLVAKNLKRDQTAKQEAALPKNNHIKDESYLDDEELELE